MNVGGRNRVPMAPLRDELERSGFREVVTIAQSGNVLVTCDLDQKAAAAAVRAAVLASSGADVAVVPIDGPALRGLPSVATLPAGADPSRVLAVVMDRWPPPGAAEDLKAFDPGRTELVGRIVVHSCPDGVSTSPSAAAFVERRWGVSATARNLRMIERIVTALG